MCHRKNASLYWNNLRMGSWIFWLPPMLRQEDYIFHKSHTFSITIYRMIMKIMFIVSGAPDAPEKTAFPSVLPAKTTPLICRRLNNISGIPFRSAITILLHCCRCRNGDFHAKQDRDTIRALKF